MPNVLTVEDKEYIFNLVAPLMQDGRYDLIIYIIKPKIEKLIKNKTAEQQLDIIADLIEHVREIALKDVSRVVLVTGLKAFWVAGKISAEQLDIARSIFGTIANSAAKPEKLLQQILTSDEPDSIKAPKPVRQEDAAPTPSQPRQNNVQAEKKANFNNFNLEQFKQGAELEQLVQRTEQLSKESDIFLDNKPAVPKNKPAVPVSPQVSENKLQAAKKSHPRNLDAKQEALQQVASNLLKKATNSNVNVEQERQLAEKLSKQSDIFLKNEPTVEHHKKTKVSNEVDKEKENEIKISYQLTLEYLERYIKFLMKHDELLNSDPALKAELKSLGDISNTIKNELERSMLSDNVPNNISSIIDASVKVFYVASEIKSKFEASDDKAKSFERKNLYCASLLVDALYAFVNMLISIKNYFMGNSDKPSQNTPELGNSKKLMQWSKAADIPIEDIEKAQWLHKVIDANISSIRKTPY